PTSESHPYAEGAPLPVAAVLFCLVPHRGVRLLLGRHVETFRFCGRAFELAHRLAHPTGDLRELFPAKKEQRHHQNDQEFLHPEPKHTHPSSRGRVRADLCWATSLPYIRRYLSR